MPDVKIVNRLSQPIGLSLLDVNGEPEERQIPEGATIVVDRTIVTRYTWGLARQGHLRISHQPS